MYRPALTLLLAIAASGASAQDGSETATSRTPANAHKFFASFTPRVGSWFTITRKPEGGYSFDSEALTILAIEASEACITTISYQKLADGNPVSLKIDWSKVEAVNPNNFNGYPVITLTMPEISQSQLWLSYSSAETRDRLLAATSYLKDACDQKKVLGF